MSPSSLLADRRRRVPATRPGSAPDASVHHAAPGPAADPGQTIGAMLASYAVLVAGYLAVALAQPAPDCAVVDCARSARHLMLAVGASVGTALLLCALLISTVFVAVRSARSSSARRLGLSAAAAGLGGALLFLAAATALYAAG